MAEPLAPDTYGLFLADLKERIRSAQLRASMSVNRELVLLYWQIGRDILDRQQRESWGAKVIDRLAADLRRAFPDMKGFSPRNLKYMRRFAEVWADLEFVQQVAAQLPWFHNCVLLDKLAGRDDRAWYARAAIQHGWSRAVLVHQIESGRLNRQGKAVANFDRTLPAPQSDLARDIIGLILCKTNGRFVAEYALRDINKPIGISEYRVAESLTEKLNEELERELGNGIRR